MNASQTGDVLKWALNSAYVLYRVWDIQKYQGKLPSENSIIIGIFWSSCKKRWHIEPRVCENNKQSEFLYKSHFLDTSTVKSSLANLRSAAIWWRAILYSSINWVASCFPCAGNSDHWSRKRVYFCNHLALVQFRFSIFYWSNRDNIYSENSQW